MAHKCCSNLIWRSIVNIPPDIDPPTEPSEALFYVYELIIDTTGSGALPIVTRLRVNGVTHNLAQTNVRGNQFDVDLNTVALAAGIIDNANSGTISFQSTSTTTLNYFAVASQTSGLTLELFYDDALGGGGVYFPMVERTVTTGCYTAVNITDSLNPIIFIDSTAPAHIGGTATVRSIIGAIGAGSPLNGFQSSDIKDGINVFMAAFYTGFGTPAYDISYTWTDLGVPQGTATFLGSALPITLLDDDLGTTYTFTPC